jgi:DNA-binding CsgD family transcriptional regulator
MEDTSLTDIKAQNGAKNSEIQPDTKILPSPGPYSVDSMPVYVCSQAEPIKLEEIQGDIECIVIVTKGNKKKQPISISPDAIPCDVWMQIQNALGRKNNQQLQIHQNAHEPLLTASSEMGILTVREKEILDLLCDGLLYKEIAEELGISALTVKNHLRNIYPKLRVANRSEAIVKYLGHYSVTCHCRQKFR